MYNKPEMASRQAVKFVKRKEGGQAGVIPLVVFLIAIVFFAWQNISLIGKNSILSKRDEQIRQELEREKSKHRLLKEEQGRLASRDYEEELIREKAMYKKPGEKIVYVSGLEKPEKNSSSTGHNVAENKFDLVASLWEDFIKIFKH
ncbi:MAG: hypothetical protein WC449_00565 [Candidatus Paceibacterota bacterium]